jgi:hypothetical protein
MARGGDALRRLQTERDRLQRALDVAKRWLHRFCDPRSDVYSNPLAKPNEIACEALEDVKLAEEA